MPQITLEWDDATVTLTVLDRDDERTNPRVRAETGMLAQSVTVPVVARAGVRSSHVPLITLTASCRPFRSEYELVVLPQKSTMGFSNCWFPVLGSGALSCAIVRAQDGPR